MIQHLQQYGLQVGKMKRTEVLRPRLTSSRKAATEELGMLLNHIADGIRVLEVSGANDEHKEK